MHQTRPDVVFVGSEPDFEESPAEPSFAPHLLDATLFWSPTGGGVRRYLLEKRDWLRSHAGWRHTVLAPGARGEGMIDCGGWPLPGSHGYRLPLNRRAIARLMTQQRPDLIEAGDPYIVGSAAVDAAQSLSVPAVAFCHSDLTSMADRLVGGHGAPARLARRIAGARLRRLYSHFDLVLAPSDAMVQTLRDCGVQRVQCQPLGVDTAVFHPARRDPVWRASFGFTDDVRVLMYAGRFSPEKNLGVLVDAVHRLGARYALLAVGAGPTPPRGAQVHVLPFEADGARLARMLASVDAFVHAGDQETFGLAVLEAMACGTPVVVRAASGLAELVADDAGIGVHSKRAGEWAEAIAAVFATGQTSWSIAARARAEEYDWSRVFPTLLRRYQRLLREYRRSADASDEYETQPAVLWHTAPPSAPGGRPPGEEAR